MDANDFFRFSSGVHGPTVVLGRLYLRPLHVKIINKTHCISTKAMKKQLTDKERIHREEQSIKIEEKDFELIPVSVNIYFI